MLAEMSERFNVPVSKTGIPKGITSSNLVLCARKDLELVLKF